MKKVLSAFVVLMSVTAVWSQVTVAPSILFMSNQSRAGTFVVMNRSNTPWEVTISFRFGFPESDSLGNTRMQYDDSLMAREHSCQHWLRVFPQRFIVSPGQQQIVRLFVSAPANIPDGEYWTRLITSSIPQAGTIDTVRRGITKNITVGLQRATTVIYEKGYLNTSVGIANLHAMPDTSSMNLLADVTRGGNSPFFGKMTAVVKDRAGNVVYSDAEVLAIYTMKSTVKFAIPLSKLNRGKYTADVTLESERNDIPGGHLLRVPTVDKIITFNME